MRLSEHGFKVGSTVNPTLRAPCALRGESLLNQSRRQRGGARSTRLTGVSIWIGAAGAAGRGQPPAVPLQINGQLLLAVNVSKDCFARREPPLSTSSPIRLNGSEGCRLNIAGVLAFPEGLHRAR